MQQQKYCLALLTHTHHVVASLGLAKTHLHIRMASDPLISAHLISGCIQSHAQVPELVSSLSKVLPKKLPLFSALKWACGKLFHFILYLTLWGVEPLVTHHTSWLESTGANPVKLLES